jgi:S1-C subfamily serine protease
VRVFNGSKMVLGTVVSKDGLVVAKNSEFSTVKPGLIRVMGPGMRIARARVVARDIPHDLIILDLGREVDPGYEWGTSKGLTHGTWLVAVVADSPPRVGVRGGVLSATTRGIKKAGGVIGVILGGRDGKSFGGVQVTEVAKGGPAEKAGVKKNDVIFAIDGKEVSVRSKMIEIVKSNDPGTTITVSLKRGEKKMDIEITLGYRNLVFAELKSRNDRMSGTVSVRRTGFERIIQHEISLAKSDMGGPLFDLEGKLVGINIAKSNRVEFFAIPVEDIRQVLEDKADEIAKAREE